LIWKLSFLFKQNWFGIDDFLLNFFATFVSDLGLQVTVGLQLNTGLQPTTRWEPFLQCCVVLSQPKKESNRQSSA